MPNSKPESILAAVIPMELIMTEILWKITDGACIARCRCVCRSWRDLLSGPSLIRRHNYKPLSPPDSSSSSSSDDYRVMFIGYDDFCQGIYSLHSPGTLEPLLNTSMEELRVKFADPVRVEKIRVAGCCNGLFCLSAIYDCSTLVGLMLWNPATSETKLLPPSPSHDRDGRDLKPVGLGFDSETNDYKVFVQQINYGDQEDVCFLLEVYSLRKDSWRVLGGSSWVHNWWEIPLCHKGKMYWPVVDPRNNRSLLVYSFGISSEAWERVEMPCPVVAADAEHVGVPGCWFSEEESMVVHIPIFPEYVNTPVRSEIWMLLKCWEPESWVKLYVITEANTIRLFGNSTSYFSAECGDGKTSLIVFDLEKGESHDLEVKLEGYYGAITYKPSQVCLSKYTM